LGAEKLINWSKLLKNHCVRRTFVVRKALPKLSSHFSLKMQRYICGVDQCRKLKNKQELIDFLAFLNHRKNSLPLSLVQHSLSFPNTTNIKLYFKFFVKMAPFQAPFVSLFERFAFVRGFALYHAFSTLSVYSPSSVLTLIVSPSLTNIGTLILAPVSRTTVLVPPVAVSPLMFGGASTILRSILIGS